MNWTPTNSWNVASSWVSSKRHPVCALPNHTHTNQSTVSFDNWYQKFRFRSAFLMQCRHIYRAAIKDLFYPSLRQKNGILTKIKTVGWGFASPVPEESYNGHIVSLKITFQLQRMIILGASWAIGCIHLTDIFSWICRMNFLLRINTNEYTKASGKIYIFLECINNLYKVSVIPKPWKI